LDDLRVPNPFIENINRKANADQSQNFNDRDTFVNSEDIRKFGWLSKRSISAKTKKNWKRRYFQLFKNRLVYFTSDQKLNLRGEFSLVADMRVEDFPIKDRGFVVGNENSKIFLQAFSQIDKNEWIAAIEKCFDELKQTLIIKFGSVVSTFGASNTSTILSSRSHQVAFQEELLRKIGNDAPDQGVDSDSTVPSVYDSDHKDDDNLQDQDLEMPKGEPTQLPQVNDNKMASREEIEQTSPAKTRENVDHELINRFSTTVIETFDKKELGVIQRVIGKGSEGSQILNLEMYSTGSEQTKTEDKEPQLESEKNEGCIVM
jgi:hypothetical protein